MKVLRVIAGAAAVAAVVAFVALRIGDSRAIADRERVIEAQQKEIKEVRRERDRHDREVQELGRAMRALDDTTRAARMGIAVKKSASIGKKLFILDNRETRAKARIRSATDAIEAVRARGRRRSWWLGVLFVVLAASYGALRRFTP